MNPVVANFFIFFLYALMIAIVLRALLSWFPIDRNNQYARLLVTVTEPILEPLRRIVPRIGMFDLSTMVAIILLIVMVRVVEQVSA
jgi:YggT family protein